MSSGLTCCFHNEDCALALACPTQLKRHEQLRTVAPETPITEALETIGRQDMNQLPVVSDGHLEGVISHGNIVQFLQARAERHL
jgi:predicted transcriptional regulator